MRQPLPFGFDVTDETSGPGRTDENDRSPGGAFVLTDSERNWTFRSDRRPAAAARCGRGNPGMGAVVPPKPPSPPAGALKPPGVVEPARPASSSASRAAPRARDGRGQGRLVDDDARSAGRRHLPERVVRREAPSRARRGRGRRGQRASGSFGVSGSGARAREALRLRGGLRRLIGEWSGCFEQLERILCLVVLPILCSRREKTGSFPERERRAPRSAASTAAASRAASPAARSSPRLARRGEAPLDLGRTTRSDIAPAPAARASPSPSSFRVRSVTSSSSSGSAFVRQRPHAPRDGRPVVVPVMGRWRFRGGSSLRTGCSSRP